MKFAQIRKYDTANGTGIRSSIFFTGCTHNCYGCFNELYQDFNYGQVWTEKQTDLIVEFINQPNIAGITLLGGEPLQQNPKEMIEFLSKVYENKPEGKTIWLYTGYTWEEVISNEHRLNVVKYCDVVIDGKFEMLLKNLRLKFRGSSNQKIIDVKKSLESGETILHME